MDSEEKDRIVREAIGSPGGRAALAGTIVGTSIARTMATYIRERMFVKRCPRCGSVLVSRIPGMRTPVLQVDIPHSDEECAAAEVLES